MGALDRIDDWPVPTASACIVNAMSGAPSTFAVYGDTAHHFRIASLSKVITSLAIMIAVEEGSVSLDQPMVSTGVPDGCTIRHLLAHASGLPFDGTDSIAPLETRRIYSNTGIELAVIETELLTGIRFGDYLREAVFEPLGVRRTELRGSPAYGIWSTVHDMALLLGELLRPTLIASSTHAEMTSVQYPTLDGIVPGIGAFHPCPWGLGVELHGDKHPHWMGSTNSPATFGHFGGAGTMMWVDPQANVALCALTDRPFDQWSEVAPRLWRELSDAVIAEVRA
jgi:CubicO group peptidase (beta-lactamase class C family)